MSTFGFQNSKENLEIWDNGTQSNNNKGNRNTCKKLKQFRTVLQMEHAILEYSYSPNKT